jgi:DNA-directed RNA polymerase subunit RPC12/RpoP
MAFIGELDDERVTPEEVGDDTDVFCPECGDRMHTWGPAVDGTARHFQHYLVENCSGESDLHKKLKSVAVSGLRSIFDSSCRFVVEETLEAPYSDKTERQADAYVEFVYQSDEQFFDGLAVEVQYKNKSKDKAAVVADYAAQGVATAFVTPNDFTNPEGSETSFALDERALRDRARRAAIRNIYGNGLDDLRRYDAGVSVRSRRDDQGRSHASVPDSWERGGKVALRPKHRRKVGAEQYIEDVRQRPKKAVVPAVIPSEQFVFDLIYKLKENNATRRCARCGAEATTYYLKDESVSQFRCERHLLDSDSLADASDTKSVVEKREVAADD